MSTNNRKFITNKRKESEKYFRLILNDLRKKRKWYSTTYFLLITHCDFCLSGCMWPIFTIFFRIGSMIYLDQKFDRFTIFSVGTVQFSKHWKLKTMCIWVQIHFTLSQLNSLNFLIYSFKKYIIFSKIMY